VVGNAVVALSIDYPYTMGMWYSRRQVVGTTLTIGRLNGDNPRFGYLDKFVSVRATKTYIAL
jgi:hypothetical protein